MDCKKLRISFICLSSFFLAMPAVVFAGGDSGLYLGVGVGDATVEFDDGSFDESDTAYKVFGGYNLGLVPMIDLAVEASYVDFGNPGSSLGNIEATGIDAFGLAGFNLGPIGFFAKLGLIDWDVDVVDSGGGKFSDSGTDTAYGIGARFQIMSIAVRAEYEVFDIDADADLSMLSVSAVFTF